MPLRVCARVSAVSAAASFGHNRDFEKESVLLLTQESHYRVDGGRLVTRLAGDTTLAVYVLQRAAQRLSCGG